VFYASKKALVAKISSQRQDISDGDIAHQRDTLDLGEAVNDDWVNACPPRAQEHNHCGIQVLQSPTHFPLDPNEGLQLITFTGLESSVDFLAGRKMTKKHVLRVTPVFTSGRDANSRTVFLLRCR
jgi:hypothetical protein